MTPPRPSFLAVCRFLRRHAPGLRAAPLKGLARWVHWFWRDARVGSVSAGGQIVAVGMGRCVDDPAEAAAPYAHRENGRYVWLDDLVSTHPQGLAVLFAQVDQRFGPREAYCGRVFSRNGEPRMIPLSLVERFILGANTHGLT